MIWWWNECNSKTIFCVSVTATLSRLPTSTGFRAKVLGGKWTLQNARGSVQNMHIQNIMDISTNIRQIQASGKHCISYNDVLNWTKSTAINNWFSWIIYCFQWMLKIWNISETITKMGKLEKSVIGTFYKILMFLSFFNVLQSVKQVVSINVNIYFLYVLSCLRHSFTRDLRSLDSLRSFQ